VRLDDVRARSALRPVDVHFGAAPVLRRPRRGLSNRYDASDGVRSDRRLARLPAARLLRAAAPSLRLRFLISWSHDGDRVFMPW